jgi:uncharacterized membrane protein YdcZ (DUF606 family)
MVSVNQIWAGVKSVVRNLPTIRKELVSAAAAGVSLVAAFAVADPNLATTHLALFASVSAFFTGTVTFLSNNTVVDEVQQVSDLPVWKSRLKYLVGRQP